MPNLDVTKFENGVDLDQMASEKPTGQNPHCFPLCCKCLLITEIFSSYLDKNWGGM